MTLEVLKSLPTKFLILLRSFCALWNLLKLVPRLKDLAVEMQTGGWVVRSCGDDSKIYAESLVQPDGDVLTRWTRAFLGLEKTRREELSTKHSTAVSQVLQQVQEGGALLRALSTQLATLAALPAITYLEWQLDTYSIVKALGVSAVWTLLALGIRQGGLYLFRRKVGSLIGDRLTQTANAS